MVPAQPLAVPGAMTQGLLGSLLARSIDLLRGHGTAAALVTNVIVSEIWRDILAEEYGTQAEVVHNGVDVARFGAADLDLAAALRKRAGGREPATDPAGRRDRAAQGSDTLMKAVAELRGRTPAGAGGGGRPFVPGLPGVPRPGAGLDPGPRPAPRRRRGAARHVPDAELPVFREYLRPGRNALMVPVNDAGALAAA